MDAVGAKVGKFPTGNTALGVEFHSHKAFGLETRLVILDNQGKLMEPDGSIHIGEFDDHNFVIAETIPKSLRNHIKAYQLQVRPYQYVDFPNIHFEPIKP